MGGRPGGGLTNGAGHEVDPGGLHLNVEAVAVGHKQPCRRQAMCRSYGQRPGHAPAGQQGFHGGMGHQAFLPSSGGSRPGATLDSWQVTETSGQCKPQLGSHLVRRHLGGVGALGTEQLEVGRSVQLGPCLRGVTSLPPWPTQPSSSSAH